VVQQGQSLPHLPKRPFRTPPKWSFRNSLGHGLRPWCLGQFRLSSPAEPRWAPRFSGEVRSWPCRAMV